jgi:Uma2 family endonuclease
MAISPVVTRPTPRRAAPRFITPPPLEPGDRLSRREFERRYEAMPDLKKAELIEGVVLIPSPVRYKAHGQPHSQIIGWLGVYVAATPGVQAADNTTVRFDRDNEVQPDVLLRIAAAGRGRSRLTDDDYLEGAPELLIEIAGSSATIDLYDKLKVYQRNGVQEYLVWQVYEDRLDWFQLVDDSYQPLESDEAGISRSRVFPGLWLHVPALLDGDLAKVLAQLQIGLNSAEHADFLTRLTPTAL